jgi:hypothetical protein
VWWVQFGMPRCEATAVQAYDGRKDTTCCQNIAKRWAIQTSKAYQLEEHLRVQVQRNHWVHISYWKVSTDIEVKQILGVQKFKSKIINSWKRDLRFIQDLFSWPPGKIQIWKTCYYERDHINGSEASAKSSANVRRWTWSKHMDWLNLLLAPFASRTRPGLQEYSWTMK